MTVVITTVALWVWRLPRITQKQPHPSSKDLLIVGKTKSDQAGYLWAPFLSANRDSYALSLARRRGELILLLALAAFATSFTADKIQNIREEISGLECSYASQDNAPRVIIAEFYVLTGDQTAFEERLFTEIHDQYHDSITVCLYHKVIKLGRETAELEWDDSETIVIWGFYDEASFDIHINPIHWDAFATVISALPADAAVLQRGSKEYIAQIVMGEISYMSGKRVDAVNLLNDAIRNAVQLEWAKKDMKPLAGAYYLLATFLDPSGGGENPSRALEAYNNALAYDPDLDAALLNRGQLYSGLSETQKAMEDFDELINKDSNLAASAYINRAILQPTLPQKESDYASAIVLDPYLGHLSRGVFRYYETNEYAGAMEDFKVVVEIEREDSYFYHLLGLAALHAGDFDTAKKAYRDMLPHLNSSMREAYIGELNLVAENDETLKPPVEEIIDMLQGARLP
ncbi:MAG: tetratricopeptide repeat protein [Chloroflexi bacterium]|nr:tetratricopeptide repeat protein [Chloroflexota bacterium]